MFDLDQFSSLLSVLLILKLEHMGPVSTMLFTGALPEVCQHSAFKGAEIVSKKPLNIHIFKFCSQLPP